MQSYAQVTPPTAVTHAISCPFLSSHASNLIVAKSSLLQVFFVHGTSHQADQPSSGSYEHDTASTKRKLVLVGEYRLAGNVSSLSSLPIEQSRSGGHALLIHFHTAKLSLIQWNPEYHDISTIAVNYFEAQDSSGSPWSLDVTQYPARLAVDPDGRCAALKYHLRNLALMPFKQSSDDQDVDSTDDQDRINASNDTTDLQYSDTNSPDRQDETFLNQRPSLDSFVLNLPALKDELLFLVDLAFLYEYGEPTLGILSSSRIPTAASILGRKEFFEYNVFSIDTQERRPTPLISVNGLPSDLFRAEPLPLPMGGCLLIGSNELVHVDQAGKAYAVAVNEFASQTTTLPMDNQSNLGLKLEGCVVQNINKASGDMLIVLQSGEIVTLHFKMDGRSVLGLSMIRAPADSTQPLFAETPSCVAHLDPDLVFIGSEEADSVLLQYRKRLSKPSRKRTHAEMMGQDGEYGKDSSSSEDNSQDGSDAEESTEHPKEGFIVSYEFPTQDAMPNLRPSSEPILVQNPREGLGAGADEPNVQLVFSSGVNQSGGLAFMNRYYPLLIDKGFEISSAEAAWTFFLGEDPTQGCFDNYILTSHATPNQPRTSQLHRIAGKNMDVISGGEFETESSTIFTGTVCSGKRLVQILPSEIKCYDPALSVTQLMYMSDDDNDAELLVTHASFLDPYILVIRNDYSALVFKAGENGQLHEMDHHEALAMRDWRSGSLHQKSTEGSNAMLYKLNHNGHLEMFALTNSATLVYRARGLSILPPVLSTEDPPKQVYARADLAEIMVADIGDTSVKTTHLILRTIYGEVELYTPFHCNGVADELIHPESLKWRLWSNSFVSDDDLERGFRPEWETNGDSDDYQRPRSLQLVTDVAGGFCAAFVPGKSPALIIKTAKNPPRILRIQGHAPSCLSTLRTKEHGGDVIFVESGVVYSGTFPGDTEVGETGWAVRRLRLGAEVEHVCNDSHSGTFIVSLAEPYNFKLPPDDTRPEYAEEVSRLRPHVTRSVIKLVDAKASEHPLDTFELEEFEVVTCLKSVWLQVAERSSERKIFVAVGTAQLRGEDLAAQGNVYLLEVVRVEPRPDWPETRHKLRLYTKKEIHAAVTAMAELSKYGLLLVGEGQKVMTYGLTDRKSLLGAGFMDGRFYVNSLKNLKGTAMYLVADALKGIWFAGFEPYPHKTKLFGKSRERLRVIQADFLPYEEQLYIIAADADCNVHFYTFNPENPRSVNGHKLLHIDSFFMGQYPLSMTLLPSWSPKVPSFVTDKHGTHVNGDTSLEQNGDAVADEEEAERNEDKPAAEHPSSPEISVSIENPDSEHDPTTNGATPQADGDPSAPHDKATSRSPTPGRSMPYLEEAQDGAAPAESLYQQYQLLFTHASGALSLLRPVSETTFRRFSDFQLYLENNLEHPCGLNARMYRAPMPSSMGNVAGNEELEGGAVDGTGVAGGRNVLDGEVLRRWRELDTMRRAGAWYRVVGGGHMAERERRMAVRELEGLLGGTLGYL